MSQQLKLTGILFLIIVSTGLNPEVVGNGNTDSLTLQEKQLVKELRPLVEKILYKDYMKEDIYLVRFLRTEDYNIQRAKKMLEELMEFRIENKMGTILLEDFSDIDKELPVVLDGSTDNYGHPLVFINSGAIDLRRIAISGKIDLFIRLYNAALELSDSIVHEMNLESKHKNITKSFIIMDLNGFNVRQHGCILCLRFLPATINAFELHYPDAFYRIYGINTPKMFFSILDLVYPLLSTTTKKVLKYFDHDSDKWKKALLSEIPANHLPTLYGGNKTDAIVTTFTQIKNTNPYAKAVFDKLLQNKKA